MVQPTSEPASMDSSPPLHNPIVESEAKRPARPSPARRLALGAFSVLNRIIPKVGKKVLVHSIPDLEDGVLSVLHEVIERGLRPVLLIGDPDTPYRFTELFGETSALFVRKESRRALVHFMTVKYIFVTHGLFGNPKPPSSQCIVNLWHGEPPTKVIGRYESQRGRQATVVPVLSKLGQAYRCTEFGLHPSQVPVLGAPRNDRLLRASRESVRKLIMGYGANRPAFLWMPTFRATVPSRHQRTDVARRFPGVPFGTEDIMRIDDWLDRNRALIIVKAHPLDADRLPSGLKAIRALSQADLERHGLTVYTMLAGFDGLITDVSSVWIDYLLLEKPIVFAFPDIEEYRASRGINLEPYENWVPGPLVRTADQLTDCLGALLEGRDAFVEIRKQALRRMHRFYDDKSTQRLVDHVFGVHRPRRTDVAVEEPRKG